jgi:hypothetical protein
MKNKTFAFGFVLALAGVFLTSAIMAQASPPATAKGAVKGANITVTYGSPSVKERKIWGELVPYDKVWRAGANEATIFETDQDIKVEGKKLAKGKYSLYAIPGEKEWTIIFNSATGQWGINRDGTTTEDPAKDVLRVVVHPKKSASFHEKLLYTVNANGVDLLWENLDVPLFIN